MSQGSVLRSVLSNIFLSDLFLVLKDIDFASYADGITIFRACNTIDDVAKTFRRSAEWFKDIQMKNNTDRFHLVLDTGDSDQIQIGNSLIKGILYENTLVLNLIIN